MIRKMLHKILILASILLLSGCKNSSTIITGTVAEEIDFNDVDVLYNKKPDCEFDVIAHIKIPGEYYSSDALIDGFRQRAAVIGAPAVQITYLQHQATGEFYGSARAIRCTNN